ncbi:Oidioi.mRNA.OKI2018_I69.PAR.g8455.t1.cds [Oikopleura dioica]|uniref:Oidioi.mRNA.OKI2018_I69.PAR.g8455.t1.cds n=1 Tax=Oikopleura dioica TaxID=34765 RepID=A0ABN7RNE0_OIKDI|nr:Oidioi.mRNA.OKI2018_I69.PAR.g8455.t1.cds [Oikopleura dioica]
MSKRESKNTAKNTRIWKALRLIKNNWNSNEYVSKKLRARASLNMTNLPSDIGNVEFNPWPDDFWITNDMSEINLKAAAYEVDHDEDGDFSMMRPSIMNSRSVFSILNTGSREEKDQKSKAAPNSNMTSLGNTVCLITPGRCADSVTKMRQNWKEKSGLSIGEIESFMAASNELANCGRKRFFSSIRPSRIAALDLNYLNIVFLVDRSPEPSSFIQQNKLDLERDRVVIQAESYLKLRSQPEKTIRMSELPTISREEKYVLDYLKSTGRMETYRLFERKTMKKWLLKYMVATKRKDTWMALMEHSDEEMDEEEEMRKADEARAKRSKVPKNISWRELESTLACPSCGARIPKDLEGMNAHLAACEYSFY